jgi:hypothetical protein
VNFKKVAPEEGTGPESYGKFREAAVPDAVVGTAREAEQWASHLSKHHRGTSSTETDGDMGFMFKMPL